MPPPEPSQPPAAVEARRVGKIFGRGEDRVVALDHISLEVRRNEFFTLLGPSGCGKTTLLRIIAGFDQPDSGQILLRGEDISSLPPHRRPVNTVFQNYALFPHMSVAENIAFGLEMRGEPAPRVRKRAREMLDLVRMADLGDRRIHQISGGQQQRVALARALAPGPRVLLLDEPLSALDYKLRKEMQAELKRLQFETGVTFVFVTHDQEEALAMSDRMAVMDRGRILQIGTPEEIYNRPSKKFVADFIGETNFFRARVVAREGERVRVRLDGGGEIGAAAAADFQVGERVSLVVRPEHARIAREGERAELGGILERATFVGADTNFHVKLSNGAAFMIREQNAVGRGPRPNSGDEVRIALAEDAARAVRE